MRRETTYAFPSVTGAWRRLRLAAALCVLTALFSGCEGGAGNRGQSQSLVEIGEQSLEKAEAGERLNRPEEANVLYRRALWAFRYHERLTGEQPFLLDEALAGVKRTARPKP